MLTFNGLVGVDPGGGGNVLDLEEGSRMFKACYNEQWSGLASMSF